MTGAQLIRVLAVAEDAHVGPRVEWLSSATVASTERSQTYNSATFLFLVNSLVVVIATFRRFSYSWRELFSRLENIIGSGARETGYQWETWIHRNRAMANYVDCHK